MVAVTGLVASAQASASGLDYIGECVPFARQVSGIQIYGNAWTWWSQAEGRYARGKAPKLGAVLVFAQSSRLKLGHVAVVSQIVERRVIMVTHANWSRVDGKRGHAEQDVTIYDVSAANDWSSVKVWYRDQEGLGTTIYPVYGFIYGTPDPKAATPHRARPAPYLTGKKPDYVGSLIDAYAP
jgi:surface antigen